MTLADIAAAQQRVTSVLRKRPSAGITADRPAVVRWDGDLRARALHDNGTEIVTAPLCDTVPVAGRPMK